MVKLSYYTAIMACVLSQIAIVLDTGDSGLLKSLWLIPCGLLLFARGAAYFERPLIPSYVFAAVFFLYCMLCETVTPNQYVGADVNNIAISVFILAISYCFGRHVDIDGKTLRIIALVTFAASFIYGVFVYTTFLVGADMFSKMYAYDDKNSAAQIMSSACIMLFTLYKPDNRLLKLGTYALLAGLLLIIFLLKSRATLLGVFFVIAYFTFMYEDKRVRYVFLVCCSSIVIYILTNPDMYRTVVEGILFANRDATDMDSLSSGRVERLYWCIDQFFANPVIGIGNEYVDCFPVIILTQYGVIGASIVFVYLFGLVRDCRELDRSDNLALCAYLLLVTYLLDSLFEAQPPFGPGVKCFPLWMVWGLMLADKYNNADGAGDDDESEDESDVDLLEEKPI